MPAITPYFSSMSQKTPKENFPYSLFPISFIQFSLQITQIALPYCLRLLRLP